MDLLDTSAVLAHYGNEPGYDVVDRLLNEAKNETGLCVASLLEIDSSLRHKGIGADERRRMLAIYESAASRVLPVDRRCVSAAIELKASARPRLPAMDALIAGCALAHGATLVHKDPHFDAIPAGRLKTLRLPDSSAATPVDVPRAVKETRTVYRVGKRKGKRRAS